MLRRFLLLLFIFLSACAGYSQDYIFNRLSIQNGLLSNNIRCIWQDTTGYLWVGSDNGLQRFDGSIYRTMLRMPVDQLVAADNGKAFIRSGKKVLLFNPQTFTTTALSYDKENTVAAVTLSKDASGKIFLLAEEMYCQYFSDKTNSFSTANNPFTFPDSIQVRAVAEDVYKKRYWIGTDKGLAYWDQQTKVLYTSVANTQHDPLLAGMTSANAVNHFFIDKKKRYWIETTENDRKKFYCFDGVQNQFTTDTSGLAAAGNGNYFDVNGFAQYSDTIVAVYGLNCLSIHDQRSFHGLRDPRINNPYNIHFNTVYTLFEDRDRILWIATDNGLYNTKGTLAKNIHLIFNQGTARGSVTGVLEDARQRIWITTWGKGIYRMDVPPGKYPVLSQLKFDGKSGAFANRAWSMCEDRPHGKLWIGCDNGGLMVYNLSNENTLLYQPGVFNGSAIRQMIKNKSAVTWLGLENGSLLKYNGPGDVINEADFKTIMTFSQPITKLVNAGDNNLWIIVKGKGLYLFDSKNEKILQSYDASTVKSDLITGINDILQYNDSTYLLAAGQPGMLHTNNKRVEFLPDIDNTVTGTIHALQKDNHGDYWLGGVNGVFKLNAKTNTLTHYSQYDGLITIHNNSYIPELSTQLSDNRLIFAGNQHMLAFDPNDYRSSGPPADVMITGFQLNDRYLREDSLLSLKRIRIPYSHNAFTIEFTSPGFLQLGKLTYEYKLEGFQQEWISIKKVPAVNYDFLPPGTYRFLVRAKNDEGLYSGTTALNIRIVPPFWKTAWFYLLLIVIVGAVLYYLHHLRLQRLLQVEKVRTRLARDLHDDMGSTLSTINILSNMAIQQTPLDEKTSKDYMNTISNSTTQMMEAMDDIVWSINPVNDSMPKVLARMKEIAGAVLEPKHVEYHFDTDNAVMNVHFSMEERREIFLVFKEALNNIIKYASCTSVQFILQKQGSNFVLVIEDNGKGFDAMPETVSVRGNGMKNMQKRAENVNGLLTVTSSTGRGTRITLSIPIA